MTGSKWSIGMAWYAIEANRFENIINYLIIKKMDIVCKLSSDCIVKIVHWCLIILRLPIEDLGAVMFSVQLYKI